MSNGDPEHGKAAGVFTGIMILLGGWGGLALAGLVLGFDYLLHGEPSERDHVAQQRAERRRERRADALGWLEADRADRARSRKAVRDWFAADPASRGDKPSRGETLGRALARAWNNLLVGGHRFRDGWRQGRAEAKQRRADGEEGWWKPNQPDADNRGTDNPEPPAADPQPDQPDQPEPPEPPEQGGPKGWTTTWFCPNCNRPMSAPSEQASTTDDRLCPACRGLKPAQQQPDPNEPIEAEIVPDPPQPDDRAVVPVGQDHHSTEVDNGYDGRLGTLQDEVSRNEQNRNDNPSPPLAALR